MIGSLRGTLVARDVDDVTIEVGGVGYRVLVTAATSAALGQPGAEVFVWVHHRVREDVDDLYGFTALDERRTFEALIGASRVGPALALSILSVHDPSTLRRVVATDDLDGLCLVPGVGRKTAARLLLDLKARLDLPEVAAPTHNGTAPGTVLTEAATPLADARAALAVLGYDAEEIRAALDDVSADSEDDSATLLRAALRRLAR